MFESNYYFPIGIHYTGRAPMKMSVTKKHITKPPVNYTEQTASNLKEDFNESAGLTTQKKARGGRAYESTPIEYSIVESSHMQM